MKFVDASLRIGLLAAIGFFSLASSTPSNEPRYGEGQDPYGYNQQQGAGQQQGPGPGNDQHGYGNVPQGVYSCYALKSQQTTGSICFASQEACNKDREAAGHDGAQTSECRPLAPVSCFQLGGNPSPTAEVCAATPNDCDLWRKVDGDKNAGAAQNGACEWRHTVAQQNQPGAPPPQQRPGQPQQQPSMHAPPAMQQQPLPPPQPQQQQQTQPNPYPRQ